MVWCKSLYEYALTAKWSVFHTEYKGSIPFIRKQYYKFYLNFKGGCENVIQLFLKAMSGNSNPVGSLPINEGASPSVAICLNLEIYLV